MPKKNFHLETLAPVDPDHACAFLSDLANHMRTNPFFVKADELRVFTNEQGQRVKDLCVSERPYFLFLRYTIRFDVRETFIDARTIQFDVHAAFGTTLHNRWEFHPENGGVRIHEYVTIEAPALTIDYIVRQAHYSHSQTFAGLPALLASKLTD